MTWSPEPIHFRQTRLPTGYTALVADNWPDQIEVDQSFLVMADPHRVKQSELRITFVCDNATLRYWIVGDRGDGVLLCQLQDVVLAKHQAPPE